MHLWLSVDIWIETVVFDADSGPGGEEGAWPYLIDEFVEYLYDKSIVEKYPAIWEK